MRVFILFLVLSICTSCGQNITKNEIKEYYASLYVRFVKDTHGLKAEASFFEEEKDGEFPPKAIKTPVLFEGDEMKARNYNGSTKYIYNTDGPYSKTYRFFCKEVFLDLALEMNDLPNWKIEPDPSISKTLDLSWEGVPLSKTESISFIFVHKKGGSYTINYLGPTQDTNLSLQKEQLKVLSPGLHEISLIRRNNANIPEEASIKGKQVMEYYTKTRNVILLP